MSGIGTADTGGGGASLLCVGLNRFQIINDDLGRSVGDELLPMVARRLADAAPQDATVARLGSDEFVVFVPGVSGETEPRKLAKALLAPLQEAFFVRSHVVQLGARVGLAVAGDEPFDPEDLIRHAEAAMRRAKLRAHAIDELSWHAARNLSVARLIERELREALASNQLTVAFQPICDLRTGRVVAAEALARWHHPALGDVSPAEFIAAAEEGGFVSSVDRFVCDVALRCMRQWVRGGWPGWVSVNLSAESLGSPKHISAIRAAMIDLEVPAGRLVLEVTESRAMRDPDATANVLERCVREGVGVAIDDFGMGHSSLAYLKLFPVDVLKVDRVFVGSIGVDARDEALFDAILALARKRDLAVIAEGVEHERQARWLASRGCRYVQGFLYGAGVPAGRFAEIVRDDVETKRAIRPGIADSSSPF